MLLSSSFTCVCVCMSVCFSLYNLEPFRIMIDNQQLGIHRTDVQYKANSERGRFVLLFFFFMTLLLDSRAFLSSPRVRDGTVSERLIHQHLRHRSLSLSRYVFRAFSKHALGSHFLSLSPCGSPNVCARVCQWAAFDTHQTTCHH